MGEPETVLREGTAADAQAVAELCESVYPGTDHVPYYWSRKLHDPACQVRIIEVGGRVAAISSLDLQEDVGWCHGARVAPAFRRRGFSTRLLRDHLDECGRRGLSRVRMATSVANAAMHRLAERQGFRVRSTYRYVCARGLPEEGAVAPPGRVRPLEPSDLDALERFLRTSGSWMSGNSSSPPGFQDSTSRRR